MTTGVSHSVGTAHTGPFSQAGPLPVTSVTRLLRVSAVLTLLAGLVASVGLFVSSGAAEAATTDPVAAWTACMKKHGVKLTRPSVPSRPSGTPSAMPSPTGTPSARPTGRPPRGAGPQRPDGVSVKTWKKAITACASVQPAAPSGQPAPTATRAS